MNESLLWKFIEESNRIEGIYRRATDAEFFEYQRFVGLSFVLLEDLVTFVGVVQPGAVLRDREGLNVRVGSHIPPSGGPYIRFALESLLQRGDHVSPYLLHCEYETLHPFTDGNGRSGRAIWLWMMRGEAPLGFLHHWYYQSLDAADGRKQS